eukprot:Hpha_TRINITY_DN9980_c0_g1::TRINITY_DN9980_c0_g1_i2::g.140468::m.140468
MVIVSAGRGRKSTGRAPVTPTPILRSARSSTASKDAEKKPVSRGGGKTKPVVRFEFSQGPPVSRAAKPNSPGCSPGGAPAIQVSTGSPAHRLQDPLKPDLKSALKSALKPDLKSAPKSALKPDLKSALKSSLKPDLRPSVKVPVVGCATRCSQGHNDWITVKAERSQLNLRCHTCQGEGRWVTWNGRAREITKCKAFLADLACPEGHSCPHTHIRNLEKEKKVVVRGAQTTVLNPVPSSKPRPKASAAQRLPDSVNLLVDRDTVIVPVAHLVLTPKATTQVIQDGHVEWCRSQRKDDCTLKIQCPYAHVIERRVALYRRLYPFAPDADPVEAADAVETPPDAEAGPDTTTDPPATGPSDPPQGNEENLGVEETLEEAFSRPFLEESITAVETPSRGPDETVGGAADLEQFADPEPIREGSPDFEDVVDPEPPPEGSAGVEEVADANAGFEEVADANAGFEEVADANAGFEEVADA